MHCLFKVFSVGSSDCVNTFASTSDGLDSVSRFPFHHLRTRSSISIFKELCTLEEDVSVDNILRLRGGVDRKAKNLIKSFRLPLNVEKGKSNSAIRLLQMQRCPKDPKVAEEGCAELWRICMNAEKQDRIGKHKNGCRALISVLQVTL